MSLGHFFKPPDSIYSLCQCHLSFLQQANEITHSKYVKNFSRGVIFMSYTESWIIAVFWSENFTFCNKIAKFTFELKSPIIHGENSPLTIRAIS